MGALQLDNRGVHLRCDNCGTTNRLVYTALGKPGRCGRCRQPLPQPGEPIEAPSAEAFDAAIAQSRLPIVVDFWAPWCGPCRMVAPELERVARSAAGEFLIVKVNTDALPELGDRFRVRSVPTMAVFKDGHEAGRTAGARPAADIKAFVTHALLQRAS